MRNGLSETNPLATEGPSTIGVKFGDGAPVGAAKRSRFSNAPLTMALPPPPIQPSRMLPYTDRKSTLGIILPLRSTADSEGI
jgi:hypothetical protein